MTYKRILLINIIAHEDSRPVTQAVLRAGLGYLAQALKDRGVEYAVLDMGLGYPQERIGEAAGTFKPDLIAVTLFTYRYTQAYERLRALRSEFPSIPIVCGGPHVSTFQEKVLEECEAVDFALMREAEETLPGLCGGAAPKDIPGLLYRENGSVRRSGAAYCPPDIDKLSFPRYSGFELEHYPARNTPAAERMIPIVTSRGCPYECVYCPVQTTIGKRFRPRQVAGVIAEFVHWHRAGYRTFSIIDDNFTLIRERVVEFCAALKRENLAGISISLPNGIRADKVDRELLELMRASGFRHLGIGVESGNDAVLAGLKKSETIATIGKAVDEACRAGFSVDLFFLVGSPGETAREVEDSIAFVREHPVDKVFFFNLIPYPGTELFGWVKEHGRLLYPPEHYLTHISSSMDTPVFETPEFPAAERLRALRRARREVGLTRVRYYERVLRGRSWPGLLASAAARIYGFEFLQRLMNDVPALKALKSRWRDR